MASKPSSRAPSASTMRQSPRLTAMRSPSKWTTLMPPRVAMANSSAVSRPSRRRYSANTRGAVAAHLGGGAIGIPVVHEPPSPAALISNVLLGRHRGGYDPDNPVATDAGSAVGQEPNLLGRHVVSAVEIRDQHEVVLGAMALGEFACA